MAIRQHTKIRREGYYFLLVLGFVITGALLREINLLVVLAGMMVGPFLFDWRASVGSLRGLRAQRRLPRAVEAGERLTVDITVEKKPLRWAISQMPSWALTVDDAIKNETFPRVSGKTTANVLFWRIARGEKKRASYRGRFHQRGKYSFGPLRVSTRFPLGLVSRTVSDTSKQSLIVYPRQGELTEAWARLYQETFDGVRSRQAQHGMHQGDFHSLRDWRPGDGTRWIHWRTTARRGMPVVRQFERHHDQDFALLLDLAPGDSNHKKVLRRGEVDETVESAVSFAATVASDICHRGGNSFFLGIASETIETFQGSTSMGMLTRMLEPLAVARRGRKDQLPELLAKTLDETRPGTNLVLITTQDVDITDTERFSCLWEHPHRRNAMGQIVTIRAGSERFDEYFVARPVHDD